MYTDSQKALFNNLYWERDQALGDIHRALTGQDGKGDDDFSRVWDSASTLAKCLVLGAAYKLCPKHFNKDCGVVPSSAAADINSCHAEILSDLIKQGAKQLAAMAGQFQALEDAREAFNEAKEGAV